MRCGPLTVDDGVYCWSWRKRAFILSAPLLIGFDLFCFDAIARITQVAGEPLDRQRAGYPDGTDK